MRFTCLSPIVVSRPVESGGKLRAHYYRYGEPGLSKAVRANLVEKFKLLYGHIPINQDLTIAFDASYIRRKRGKISKLIDFKGTRIKGILAPFTAEGSPELMEVGYEAGFGEKNSMGFGMAEVIA
jgi:CRISPR-associated endoribonuclease Cas6